MLGPLYRIHGLDGERGGRLKCSKFFRAPLEKQSSPKVSPRNTFTGARAEQPGRLSKNNEGDKRDF